MQLVLTLGNGQEIQLDITLSQATALYQANSLITKAEVKGE